MSLFATLRKNSRKKIKEIKPTTGGDQWRGGRAVEKAGMVVIRATVSSSGHGSRQAS